MEFKEYRDEINHIFAHYIKGRFVNYYDCRGLRNDITTLLVEATLDLGRHGQYKELFDLANKAFLKWSKTDKDDSDGETQDFVAYVTDSWDAVYNSGDKVITHEKMLVWFMKNLDGSVIDFMEDELYKYMMDHFKEQELLKKKMIFLEEKIVNQKNSGDRSAIEFYMPRCQTYVLTLMGELSYPIEEIRIYAADIKSYFVGQTLAKIEINYGNINEAIAIYETLADREDGRWGRNEYRVILMKLYKDAGNYAKYFESLKKAMLSAVGDTDLWEEYKSNFTAETWAAACDVIFSRLKMGDSRANRWYAGENRYDLVMANIEKFRSTDQLKVYEKNLKKFYPDRCSDVLVAEADNIAKEGNKRSDYRKLASTLRWIQRYPNGNEKSEELAKKYRMTYPRRTAMIEELEKF